MDRRIPSLDGLRAIAILSVLLTHTWETPDYPILTNIAFHGTGGVDLFFVLSGFLITGVLLGSRDQESGYYRNFYGRRVLRIFPVYYLVLLLIFVCWSHSPYLTQARAEWPWYFLFASNIALALSGPQLKLTDVTWSLAVEEQFYFIWPTVVRKVRGSALAQVCIAIIVAVPIARLMLQSHMSRTAIAFLTPFRIDEFAIGALICIVRREARLSDQRLLHWGRLLFFGAGGLYLVTSALNTTEEVGMGWYGQGVHFTVTGAAAGGLLLLALYSPRMAAILQTPVLRHIGTVSYGMYLYHQIVYIAVSKAAELMHLDSGSALIRSICCFTSVTALTIGVATLSYRYFELPFLRLKRFFTPRSTKRLQVANDLAT